MTLTDMINILLTLVTIVAIVAGPIAAVRITRKIDEERAAKQRKLDIFRILMRTRKERLAYDHVGAINLVELEFYGIAQVIKAYSNYIDHLYKEAPQPGKDSQFHKDRDVLFASLLKTMGEHLGYKFDKMDLERLSYSPVGWENDNRLNRNNQLLLNEILSGRRVLPIRESTIPPDSMFPEPPKKED